MALLFRCVDETTSEETFEVVDDGRSQACFMYHEVLESQVNLQRVHAFISTFLPFSMTPSEFFESKGGREKYLASKGVLFKKFKQFLDSTAPLWYEELQPFNGASYTELCDSMNGITSYGEKLTRRFGERLTKDPVGRNTDLIPLVSMAEITRGSKKGVRYAYADPVPIYVVKEYLEEAAKEFIEHFYFVSPASIGYPNSALFRSKSNGVDSNPRIPGEVLRKEAKIVMPLSCVPSTLDVLPDNLVTYVISTDVTGVVVAKFLHLLLTVVRNMEGGGPFINLPSSDNEVLFAFRGRYVPVLKSDIEALKEDIRQTFEGRVVCVDKDLVEECNTFFEKVAVLLYHPSTIPLGRKGWRILFKEVVILQDIEDPASQMKGKAFSFLQIHVKIEMTHDSVPGMKYETSFSYRVYLEHLSYTFNHHMRNTRVTVSKEGVYLSLLEKLVMEDPYEVNNGGPPVMLNIKDMTEGLTGRSTLARFMARGLTLPGHPTSSVFSYTPPTE